MPEFFAVLLRVHLACALSATAAFWIAAFAAKGGRVHRAAGRWFARLIFAAAWTGGVMAVAALAVPTWVHPGDLTDRATQVANRQVMWLVLYVLVIIVAPVQHGLAVVAAGPTPRLVRSPLHVALCLAGMVGTLALLAAAVLWQQWLFLIVVPIGLAVGLRNLSYASRRTATREEWQQEHLTSLITAGVTLHTAFFVFGTSRSLGLELGGVTSLIPWMTPAIVGIPVIAFWRMRVRKAAFE